MDYEISVEAAAALLKAGGENAPKLIDVRELWEFGIALVAGSVLIPMGEFAGRAHQELDPEDHLLIMCHHGARSLSVTNWLRHQGFDLAQSVSGGIDAWAVKVDGGVGRY